MRRRARGLSLVLALAAGCDDEPALPDAGTCELTPALDSQCTAGVDGGTAAGIGLAAYTCTGSARPDDRPRYIDGVPQGVVCADQGGADGGVSTYCCTVETTTCAYNPVAICDPGTYGFQCLGANRPESLNPELECGQGVIEGDYIDYCCADKLPPDGCTQTDTLACTPGQTTFCCPTMTTGFNCAPGNLPRAEQLGANKSRADIFYFTCSSPSEKNGRLNYCCIVPAPMPEGGSCITDTVVPGCAPGRFGFACYGRDTPADDYSAMTCPEGGTPGLSAEGYPATLYCCDLQPSR